MDNEEGMAVAGISDGEGVAATGTMMRKGWLLQELVMRKRWRVLTELLALWYHRAAASE